jgi:hypothetical protein
MKPFSFAPALLFLASLAGLALLCCTPSCLADGKTFTLHNQTGKGIKSIYIGPMNSDGFGEDVAVGKIVADGSSVQITCRSAAAGNRWEMQVTFVDDTSTTWRDLDLTEIKDLSISFKEGKPVAKAK